MKLAFHGDNGKGKKCKKINPYNHDTFLKNKSMI